MEKRWSALCRALLSKTEEPTVRTSESPPLTSLADLVTHEFVYTLQIANNTVSDIVAINDHEFLVDERDGQERLAGAVKQIYKIDVSAPPTSRDMTVLPSSFTAVSKGSTPFINLLDPAFGLNNAEFPAKIEGMAFGDDVVVNGVLEHTLWVTNDNDFTTTETNNFYVFGIPASDLPDYQAQANRSRTAKHRPAVLRTGHLLRYVVRRARASQESGFLPCDYFLSRRRTAW